jgi:TrmH family RNA methyltransferase
MHSLKIIKKLAYQKYREQYGLTVIEGPRFIHDVSSYTDLVSEVFVLKNMRDKNRDIIKNLAKKRIKVYTQENVSFRQISDTVHSQGIIGIAKIPRYNWGNMLAKKTCALLYMDRIQDPGNMGSILRSALAFKSDGVIIGRGCTDVFSPKVVRASSGCNMRIPVFKEAYLLKLLKDLKNSRFQIITSEAAGDFSLRNFKPRRRYCLVLGNEGEGIQQEIRKTADTSIYIPINKKVDSLNVGVAAGILLSGLSFNPE